MDWSFVWCITASVGFLLTILNLVRSCMAKNKGWQIMMYIGLSCGAITILEEYRMVNTWLQHGDIGAIQDVVPSLTHMLTVALYLGLFLNLIILVINLIKANK